MALAGGRVSGTWAFTAPDDETRMYTDGTLIPSRRWRVTLDGVPVAEIEVHLHRRRGRDGQQDISVGTTTVVFGPPTGGS